MNRQIKFRGKDPETKEWLRGSLIQRLGHYPSILFRYVQNGEIAYCERSVIPYTVGQFTGLHDANDEEIYEGDILTFKLKATRWKPVVTWNNEIGAWCVKMDMQDRAGVKPLGEWLQEEPFVVIGNIYDNTSLLKGGKE